jgi:hypothetical protein
MTLKYSRRSFRKVVWKSGQGVWAKLHEEAFRYFGGCPQYVVLDNLKEGVIKPDIYEPELNAVNRGQIEEADKKIKYQFPKQPDLQEAEEIIKRICKKEKISFIELRSGSRRRCIVSVRKQIAIKLVEDYGFSLAETARQLGVTTPAISISLNNAGSL